MKKKRAKVLAGSLCGILAMTSPIQSIATTTISHVENGISYADYANSGHEGYSVVRADPSALSGDLLVIPESVNGKDVVHLGSNFLSESGAGRAEVGKNIIAANADAFFEAKDLVEITSNSRAFTVSDDDPALYTYQHSILLDYPSAASNGGDYTVHEGTKVIYSMDNARFGKLDLMGADTLAKHVLAGTTADELVIADNVQTTTGSGSMRLSLPGLHAGTFSLTNSDSGSYLRTDGDSLYTNDGVLIKLASDVMDGIDWSKYQAIDTDAFDSMAQYWSLSGNIPESLKKDNVFHFYNQNNGVFIVNDQTAFCYNSSLQIPDRVTDSADFSNIIDGDNYDKVCALMFAGVPYDGTGLFEKIFGTSYEEVIQDTEMSRNGNAALNAVSSLVWELVDGNPSNIINGIGDTSYFTEENVETYMEALREAVSHPENYTYSPTFEIEGGVLTFREQDDGTFLSDVFKVTAVDGNGIKNEDYKIQMTLSGEDFGIYESNSMVFTSGTEIRLTSKVKPEGQPLSFTYEKGNLVYYAPGGSGEQNLLVSGKKTEATAIQYAFEVKPVKEELTISKRAVGGSEELPGASLKITNAAEEVVDEWVSGSEPHIIAMPEDGEYTLTETIAPGGYEIAESITFTVIDGKTEESTIIMYDAPVNVPVRDPLTISKRAVGGSEELPGASLKITNANGVVIDEWVSGRTPHVITMPDDGEYTLTEITAPNGYEVAESITFTITDSKTKNNTIIMYDVPVNIPVDYKITISKRAVGGSEELPGATLKITNAYGVVIDEWVSGNIPHIIYLPENEEYILTEIIAPDGYEIAESITFTVTGDNSVIMYDAPKEEDESSFYVSKQDITTSEELLGASLKITDKAGNTVEEWVSGNEPHEVKNLPDGVYTLTETTAPDGYEVAESITFTVTSGKTEEGTIIMYDTPEKEYDSSFSISKRDVTTGDELPGASLEITDENGNTIEKWVSGNKPHEVKNLPDGIYVLTEIIAPDGYEIAESITFTVKGGTVEGNTVVMYDAPEEVEEPSFAISKKDVATGDELPGAKLVITDEDGDTVEEWVSGNKPHEVKGLPDGIYTLTEITAPDGYEIAEDITFTVKKGTVDGGKVVMYDEPEENGTPSEPDKPSTPSEPDKPDKPDTPDKPDRPDEPDGYFYISKRDAANSNELPGAKLKITDAAGNIIEEWISTNTPHKVTGLEDGVYTLTEVTAPHGYSIAESITFTVNDQTVENGSVVMYNKALPGKSSGGGGGGGGGSRGNGGSDTSHGPGVENPETTEPVPTPEPQPTPPPEPPIDSDSGSDSLPVTSDLSSSTLVFWAAALTLAGIVADKKKYRTTN